MRLVKIPLRTFQRNTKAFTDLLAANGDVWAEVIDGGGEVLFLALDPKNFKPIVRQGQKVSDGDTLGTTIVTSSGQEQVATINVGSICDKCHKRGECRKWIEEGMDYKICIICALKAKLNWNKLEKT